MDTPINDKVHSEHDIPAARERRPTARIAACGCVMVACLLSIRVAGSEAVGPVSTAIRPPFPTLQLPSRLQGEEAIAALQAELPALAAFYRKTPEDLRAALQRDRSLWVDRNGRLYYVCDRGPAADGAAGTDDSFSIPKMAPPEQTFRLHSRPGASKVIYLDFDGHTISGTAWNATRTGGADIVAPAWDTDGNPSVFGGGELTAIQQIWLRVAEDFSPYDVDVTTEYPGEAALTRNGHGDPNFGTRALISPIGYYFGNPGGIAYIGTFDDIGDFYEPALIFPENLGHSEKKIAEAISHEVGHNLGLNHDGTTTGAEYYSGHGDWAPIMGMCYDRPISQWSRNEYANANNAQNDLVVMTQNGLSFRADDHGNSIGTATPLAGPAPALNGVIEQTSDVDMFSFQAASGVAQVSVIPAERGANLHLRLSIYDAGGNLLTNREAADTSSGAQPVSITRFFNAGTCYLAVEGTGSDDPLTTGYADYGSLGQYAVSITSVATAPAPKITPLLAGGTNLVLQFPTASGFSYVLESAPNLTPPVLWTPLQTNQGNGAVLSLSAPVGPSQPQKYFRVRVY